MNLLDLKYGRDRVETPGFLTVRCYWKCSQISTPFFEHLIKNHEHFKKTANEER